MHCEVLTLQLLVIACLCLAGSQTEEEDAPTSISYPELVGAEGLNAEKYARDSEVFSSTYEMSRLLRREVAFSADLDQYARELRVRKICAVASVKDHQIY